VRRVNLFLKGNLDVRDSLHSLRLNGEVRWNGVNEILRARFPDTAIRLQHETWTRSDALLASDGEPPAELAERRLPLGAYPARVQFSHTLFDARADAIILSIQPDIATNLLRHREHGYLLHPADLAECAPGDLAWLRSSFEPIRALDPARSMENFRVIVDRLRHRSDAPILVYNVSSVVPGDRVHCHGGFDDMLSTRIRRFNLALITLSQETGISIVDVDAIVARHGADRLKVDALHLNADGCRLVAEEVVSILNDLGVVE
jgi:hypothetical protein